MLDVNVVRHLNQSIIVFAEQKLCEFTIKSVIKSKESQTDCSVFPWLSNKYGVVAAVINVIFLVYLEKHKK